MDLAKLAGVSLAAVQKWESLKAPTMYGRNYLALARAFGLTPDELDREWRGSAPPAATHRTASKVIPIINKTPAGPAHDYEDVGHNHYDYLPLDPADPGVAGDENAFAVEVVGDSMMPTLAPGDRVVLSPSAKINDGDIAFVRFDGSRDGACTLKRVHGLGRDRVELRPENKAHRPMVVRKEEIIRMARAVGHYRKL